MPEASLGSRLRWVPEKEHVEGEREEEESSYPAGSSGPCLPGGLTKGIPGCFGCSVDQMRVRLESRSFSAVLSAFPSTPVHIPTPRSSGSLPSIRFFSPLHTNPPSSSVTALGWFTTFCGTGPACRAVCWRVWGCHSYTRQGDVPGPVRGPS